MAGKNFKSGQSVVFSIDHLVKSFGMNFEYIKKAAPPGQIWPKDKEVVTIFGPCTQRPGWWYLKEYYISLNDLPQIFSDLVLFPLEEISKQETEKITEKIESEINKRLVFA